LDTNQSSTDKLQPDSVSVQGGDDQRGGERQIGAEEIIRKPRRQTVQDLLREDLRPDSPAGLPPELNQGILHSLPAKGQAAMQAGQPLPGAMALSADIPANADQQKLPVTPPGSEVQTDAGGVPVGSPSRVGKAASITGVAMEGAPVLPYVDEEPRRRNAPTRVLLQTHGLVKVYDGRAVVDGVDINVRQQEIVGLLGPNGAGKTTTFYMIVGLIQPNGGHVEFDGEDATNEPMYRRARLGMGYLPQEESIFRKLTVEENIMAVLETQLNNASERRDRCQHLMKRFGIEKLAKNLAITLSGGEKRRLTIARSLVVNPKLLMLDEPFSGVDPIAVGEIQEIICHLREQGLAILITDHNVRETLGIVDRAYLICEGKVLLEGSRDELVSDPEARTLYLGERFSM
jgi:lipopolysaccharide export system ATP-binding protein